jgi:hypothetical protein
MNYLSQSWLLNRRYALRAMGTCISLPLLECMVPLRAAEERTATPRRSAFIYLANGVHSLNYQITAPGKDYQFSRSLKPLQKHREVITPISGLHHPGALSHHHNCISVWLTGGKLGPSDRNTISVDQRMAEVTAKHTRYPSMEIALTGDSLGWTADGVRLPSMRRCSEIFASLFAEPKGGIAAQRRALRQKASVLDANLAEVRRIEQAMGSADKGRLDQYLTSVRETEIRTRRADAWLDTPLPTVSDSDRQRTNRDVPATMAGDYFRTVYDLILLAFQTDVTRVDHVNRRGSIRVQGSGMFFRNDPHPFAMLPYGIVGYRGAPADLRDIPLGTVLHLRAFLPPDPKISAVPVLPVNSKNVDANHNRGAGIAPAENHILLLEDEPSHCRREGKIWKLKEVEIKSNEGTIIASRESKVGGDAKADEEKLTFDASTRFWRGREFLGLADLIAEGAWPAEGKKSMGDQAVLLGITWKPTPDGIFTRFHISDIWLDDEAMQRAAHHQIEVHKAFIRSRWMPAWVDAVEYGKFGRAKVSATLFGGMDDALYADFKKDSAAMMNAVENTLKHTHGAYGPAHMASRGSILEVTKTEGDVPLGSSGIQILFETDLIIEGIRPGRVVRIRPNNWPQVQVPREEYLNDATNTEERFPTPAIFPKY